MGDENEAESLAAAVADELPSVLVVENVEGFLRRFDDLDCVSALECFVKIMTSINRPDGTQHFRFHCTVKQNMEDWCPVSRPRTVLFFASSSRHTLELGTDTAL